MTNFENDSLNTLLDMKSQELEKRSSEEPDPKKKEILAEMARACRELRMNLVYVG